MVELEIVVVAYRSRALVRACLESLQRYPAASGQLVHLVDNASGDGTVEMVREEFPGVRVHALAENAGFSVANNVALREADADFVLLLNPDTEVRAGVLDHALAEIRAQRDVGMLGVRLEQPDGTFDHAAKRSFPTPIGALGHFLGIGRAADSANALSQYRATDVDEYDVGDVDAVNGAFMLVRRTAMERVGLLDEGYWLYMEDLDWCRRFHLAGWRVVYDGRVSMLHVKGGTAGKRRGLRQNVAFHRGMGRFYRRFEAGRRPWLDWLVYVGIVGKLAVSVSRNALARST